MACTCPPRGACSASFGLTCLSTKIRTVLEYYRVPYHQIDGKKPDSEYQKLPVLDIGDLQINDSCGRGMPVCSPESSGS